MAFTTDTTDITDTPRDGILSRWLDHTFHLHGADALRFVRTGEPSPGPGCPVCTSLYRQLCQLKERKESEG